MKHKTTFIWCLKRILSVIQRFLGVIASKMLNITKRGRK